MNARVRVRQGVKQGRLGCARAVDGLCAGREDSPCVRVCVYV